MRFFPVLCASLLPVAALAAPPPSSQRISALVVPMDKGAEAQALKLEGFINEALNEYQGFTVKTSDELFGIAVDEDAAASLKRAQTGFAESKADFDNRQYEPAERKLRATLKEFDKSVAAMKTCGNLCEAWAMYGAVLQSRGDSEEAKLAVLNLLALSPSFEVDRKRYPQDFLSLKAQVAISRNAQLRGNIVVKTKPAGARVYLNGEFQGYSPLTLQTLPIGKAMVKVEKPGFRQVGQMIEVTPDDSEFTPELIASSGFKAFDALMDRLAAEALKDKGGSTMASVSKSLGLDRGIVAVVKELESGGTELTIGYYELKTGKRLAIKRTTMQGDEFGEMKGEVQRMVTWVINNGDGPSDKVTRSADPLDNRAGTEDWNGEDRGGRTQNRDKKKGGKDPLDGVNGTEDW
ncbi:MAG: PEGA domain-containing protein [Myxococcaceae bacterium]|nr:PEGA domain-containing protein [Myxococcaceae bacterium]